MFQHLVVPIDGSEASWSAVPIAASMAAAVDGKLDVVTVVDRIGSVVPAKNELAIGIGRLGAMDVEPMAHVLASDSVARAVANHVEGLSGATVVMSSHGHGRSAAVLGSVADELLQLLFGPIVVVGPNVTTTAIDLSGDLIVPVDGSPTGEQILPIVEAWMIEFGATPWIVEVVEPKQQTTQDVFESAYASRLAQQMHTHSGRAVEFEVLHGDRPAAPIVEFAEQRGAALICATTHGRTGMARLRSGSVTAEIVKHATCPVLLHRPPHLPA
jgi:nucleotide-binding universal stress UspA family protein